MRRARSRRRDRRRGRGERAPDPGERHGARRSQRRSCPRRSAAAARSARRCRAERPCATPRRSTPRARSSPAPWWARHPAASRVPARTGATIASTGRSSPRRRRKAPSRSPAEQRCSWPIRARRCAWRSVELAAGNCPPPPVDSDDPRLLRQGESVAGALSRDAARITLQLDRGQDVTVPHDGRRGLHRTVGGQGALLRGTGACRPRGDRRGRPQRGRHDHRHQPGRRPTRRGPPHRAGATRRPGPAARAPRGRTAVPDGLRRGPADRTELLHRPRSGNPDRRPRPAVQRRRHGRLHAAPGDRLRPPPGSAPGAARSCSRETERSGHARSSCAATTPGSPSCPDATVASAAGRQVPRARCASRRRAASAATAPPAPSDLAQRGYRRRRRHRRRPNIGAGHVQ